MFDKLTLCFDKYGCPSRCKHCYIYPTSNNEISDALIAATCQEAYQLASEVCVYRYTREPDFSDNYQREWLLENEQSRNCQPVRYQLLSDYRLNFDKSYLKWLKQFDVKTYQLTLFGSKELTNYYTGRTDAYDEVINATNILLDNGLVPRWQFFCYQDTVKEIDIVLNLIEEMELVKRSKQNGGDFKFFIHGGSCDGLARQLYPKWMRKEDLSLIPSQYYQGPTTTETEILNNLSSNDLESIVTKEPVIYIDSDLNVTPNISTAKGFRLGNLHQVTLSKCLSNYQQEKSQAQRVIKEVSIEELKKYGQFSTKLFDKEDYIIFLINKYLENNPNF